MFENAIAETSAVTTTTTLDSSFEGFDGGFDWAADPPTEPTDHVRVPAVDPAIYGIESEASDVHAAAAEGIATPTSRLPHFDRIQAAFGAHDISGIQSHVGGSSASEMGAKAFAAGTHVVFDREPDLHTAAHEAAHVIQQARGVNLYGGVGEAGDAYERAADAVADRVVAGQSAGDLLGAPIELSVNASAVQRKEDPSLLKARADGHRAHTVSAHLRLGAMRIQDECNIVEGAIHTETTDAAAVMKETIKPAYSRVSDVHRALHPILEDMQQLKFKDGAIQDGFGIFNTAKRRFFNLTQGTRGWAGRNQVDLDGVNSRSIDRIAGAFGDHLGVEHQGRQGVWGTEDPKTTEAQLIKETVGESLEAVEDSVNALAQAMREDDAKTSTPPLAHRALVDLHLLDASIPPNAKTSAATAVKVAKIAKKMEQAFRDASFFGLDRTDGNLMNANGLMSMVRTKIDNAKNAKASK